MFPTPIHYHTDHSSLFLWLVSNLSFQQWETAPTTHYPFPCHVHVQWFSGFWIVSLWGGGHFINQSTVLTYSSFSLCFHRRHSFPKLLSTFCCIFLSEVLPYVCNRVGLCYHSLLSILDPMISYLVFKILHILRFNRCAVKLGVDKCPSQYHMQ